MQTVAVVLASVGGCALALAFSLALAWPALFVAVIAFVLALELSPSRSQRLVAATVYGWVAYVGGYYWLQPTLESLWAGRLSLSWLVWLGFGLWVCLRFPLIAWGYDSLRARGVGAPVALVLPWVTTEWLYPSLFPFYLANALIDRTLLVQVVALGGPLLLSAWVCMVGAFAAELVLSRGGRLRPLRTGSVVLVVATAAVLGYGAFSVRGLDTKLQTEPVLTVGVIQANVDVVEKQSERALSHRRHLVRSRALESEGPLDLLIWPETSYLQPLPHEIPTSSGSLVRADLDSPLLFGAVTAEVGGGRRRYNSALLVDQAGAITAAYDKQLLIPFAEYVPFGDRFERWARIAPTLSRFSKGASKRGIVLGSVRVATPICYETILPGYVRRLMRRTRAHLLVSLTNDGWLGDSSGPDMHLRLARLRAVEHRRFLVRATNTGVSAIVDPLGRVVDQTPTFEAASLRQRVRLREGGTPYARLGDWPGYLSGFAWAWLVVRRRKPLAGSRLS